MTDRASTLIDARRERIERILGRDLKAPRPAGGAPLSQEAREYLVEEAQNLYWNDLEWEHITDEEALEQGAIAQLAFPGFLAYIRGLLLHEVMPDSQAPASPRPQVVADVLGFLAKRVVELEDGLATAPKDEVAQAREELALTSQLVDLVLYEFHGVGPQDVERIEAAG
ncbi:MAG: hypothetical protein FJ207_10710 [Gemmatimonadetes bacterium]|nr:hypothetical protein [Gemmatimonadota bacterium]